MGYYKRFIAIFVSIMLFAIFLLQATSYMLLSNVNSLSSLQITQAYRLPASITDSIAPFERNLSPKDATLSDLLFTQETITDSLIYLQTTQNTDGSWGGTTTSLNGILPTTGTALRALQIAEPMSSTYQLDAIQFLTGQSLEVTPFIAERILALASTGVDVTADVDTLISRQNEDGGWGTSAGYQSNLWDTALVLSALKAAGSSEPILLGQGISYLNSWGNNNGGWGLAPGDNSRVFYTALALQTLNSYQALFAVSGLQADAVAYLRGQQQADGGYGDSASTPFETALVLQAIMGAGLPLTTAENDALAYLETEQLTNGSWVDDPYSTALALRTLLFPRDSDGDGMSDECEIEHGLDPNDPGDALLDNDNDGLLNLDECRRGTDPNEPDTDMDGVDDPIEIQCLSDPLNPADFNQPPQITSSPPTIARAGDPYTYTVTATDADGDMPIISLVQSPPGMAVSTTSTISWTPTLSQTGNFGVVVKADDERGCQDYQPFHLRVLAQGIDLTIDQVDTIGVEVDLHTLVAIGTAQVTVHNLGGSDFQGQFRLRLFEDHNDNGTFESGTDLVLGTKSYSGTIATAASLPLDVNLSGIVLFRDNLVYAQVDSQDQVIELDETNNYSHSGQDSLYQPPPQTFQPVVEWQWDDPNSSSYGVSMAPIVAPITDTNGDSLINERDIPAVIVTTAFELLAFRGDTGQQIFSAPVFTNNGLSHQATVADLQGDGIPEILVASVSSGNVDVYDNTGTHLWTGTELNWGPLTSTAADIDEDGIAEVLHGKRVFDATGTLLWGGSSLYAGGNGGGMATQAADLDLDGTPEVIIGPSAFDNGGNMIWRWSSYSDPACNHTCYLVTGLFDGGGDMVQFQSPMSINDGFASVVNVASSIVFCG